MTRAGGQAGGACVVASVDDRAAGDALVANDVLLMGSAFNVFLQVRF